MMTKIGIIVLIFINITTNLYCMVLDKRDVLPATNECSPLLPAEPSINQPQNEQITLFPQPSSASLSYPHIHILEQIKKYESTKAGSFGRYLSLWGIAALNCSALYLCDTLKGLIDRFGGNVDLDDKWPYVRDISLGASLLLGTAPVIRAVYYLGKKRYHHSKISNLIQQSLEPDDAREILKELSSPGNGMDQLDIPEQYAPYIADYQKALRKHPQLENPPV